jgi:hypothetical protein
MIFVEAPVSRKNVTSKEQQPINSRRAPHLSIVPKEKKIKRSKKSPKVDDEALVNFVKNAHHGEKKTEAGIKYWFEQNIPGHQTEDNTGDGFPDGYTAGWLVLELKGKQQDWLEGFFQGIARKELSFKRLVVACHNQLLIFPGPKSEPDEWDEQKKQDWRKVVKETISLNESPNKAGKTLAAKYKSKGHRFIRFSIFQWSPEEAGSLIPASQTQEEAIQNFRHIVTTFDSKSARVEITSKNFSTILKSLLPYFDATLEKQFEVVHGFFRSMTYWNNRHAPILSEAKNIADLLNALARPTTATTTIATGTPIALNPNIVQSIGTTYTNPQTAHTLQPSTATPYALVPPVQTFTSPDLQYSQSGTSYTPPTNTTIAQRTLENLKQVLLTLLKIIQPFGVTRSSSEHLHEEEYME